MSAAVVVVVVVVVGLVMNARLEQIPISDVSAEHVKTNASCD